MFFFYAEYYGIIKKFNFYTLETIQKKKTIIQLIFLKIVIYIEKLKNIYILFFLLPI